MSEMLWLLDHLELVDSSTGRHVRMVRSLDISLLGEDVCVVDEDTAGRGNRQSLGFASLCYPLPLCESDFKQCTPLRKSNFIIHMLTIPRCSRDMPWLISLFLNGGNAQRSEAFPSYIICIHLCWESRHAAQQAFLLAVWDWQVVFGLTPRRVVGMATTAILKVMVTLVDTPNYCGHYFWTLLGRSWLHRCQGSAFGIHPCWRQMLHISEKKRFVKISLI